MRTYILMTVFAFAFAAAGCNAKQKSETNSEPESALEITYEIGDTGPAGGIVFYDKGSDSDGWRYLEAAPASTEFYAEWGLDDVPFETEIEIGTGKHNTPRIAAALTKNGETGRAAQRVAALQVNEFDDWFLPSWNELGLMYSNLYMRGLGGFTEAADYWSSSSFGYPGGGDDDEVTHLGAYNMPFMQDGGGIGFARAQNNSVRAIRAF